THGYELSPAGEAAGMALGLMLKHQLLKFQTRKHLEYLRKHAAYWAQGGTSSVENCRSRKPQPQLIRDSAPSFSNANLDKPGLEPKLQFASPPLVRLDDSGNSSPPQMRRG